jgi:hypothetical protein
MFAEFVTLESHDVADQRVAFLCSQSDEAGMDAEGMVSMWQLIQREDACVRFEVDLIR